MKAAVIDAAGAAPRYDDFAVPEPAEGEQLMRVVAAGIHPVVRGMASGRHYASGGTYPLVPGVDAVAIGDDGVARYTGLIRAPWGTMAEQVAARFGVPLPDGADPIAVAGGLNPGMSSWMPLLARTGEVQALGTVLIVGATGVAGRIAVQNAFALGADHVVGVGRNPERLDEIGALGGVPVALADGPEAIARALDGTSPSIVVDFAWGEPAEAVWQALSRRGLHDDEADIVHVQIGTMAGATAALPGALLRSRRIVVRGAGAGSTPVAELMKQLPGFVQRVADGEVVVPVRAFALSQVAEAWAYRGAERAVVVPD
ncbi:zinc-binding alcohol dehydrogenase family protein [Microbacterium horticulturae]|uniref:Zinc-binding alcohol dehydrogenase family protein n=1 Tax=Microbacterium horticulturae TaxID=3028316 RepID=A0ABY8BZ58_9MICO|nr:zinc-binding alcohol dehydrogenase family protein [Microbacterium sp. KACC 23027]WEG09162.1 zinc-binding alcohol dehydrogenase family protein [Microbacterium sp. KACC 23027]